MLIFPMFARTFSILTNALLIGLVLGAAVPGPHRAILPNAFGLTEIAPRVWTDMPGQAGAFRTLVETSRDQVAEVLGSTSDPVVILCATQTCAHRFGIRGNGASVAYLAVLVSPGGLTRGTLTHEMTHSRLHRSMGPRNLIRQPYPTWFDEGLATHIANHPTWRGQVANADRARIRQVRRFWNWDDAYRALGVGRAYSAAAAEVAAIETHAGRDGLLELINRAEQGEDFDMVLAQIMSR